MTLLLLALLAHDVITTKITWTVEISRVFSKRCSSCHGSGSSVDLSSYQQTRPWATSIRNQVLQRKMPPWGAVKGFGDFRNDPSLMPLEMEMITQWVEGGAPEGDTAFLPHAGMPAAIASYVFHWAPLPPKVSRPLTIRGIRATGPTEVSAYLPDGTVRHLIWIREKQSSYRQPFVLREPLTLPAGTIVKVTGAPVQAG